MDAFMFDAEPPPDEARELASNEVGPDSGGESACSTRGFDRLVSTRTVA